MLTNEQKNDVVELPKPTVQNFSIYISDYGLLDDDNGEGVRAFVSSELVVDPANNASFELILLTQKPKKDIYEVYDYPVGSEKKAVMGQISATFSKYGRYASKIRLEDALEKGDSVIIIPSDALPDQLAEGRLMGLLDNNNTVVFFGKSLDILIDQTASQKISGQDVYKSLNVTINSQGMISPEINGPKVLRAQGNATILNYEQGTIVLYNDRVEGGEDIAALILAEGWQHDSINTSIKRTVSGKERVDLFSSSAPIGNYSIRLLYSMDGANKTYNGLVDLDSAKRMDGTLKLDSNLVFDDLSYSFELHDDLEYPTRYDLSLQFVEAGKAVSTKSAKTVFMKTVSIDSGKLTHNLSAGTYIVRLLDQNGLVHAQAYTHVPRLRVRLVRIEGSDYVFRITSDGAPLTKTPITLSVDEQKGIALYTDSKGEARRALALSPGMHSFTVDTNGQRATTYYEEKAEANWMLYFVFIVGLAFLGFSFFFRSKERTRLVIRTYQRPSGSQRTLTIPYDVFLKIFRQTQECRAKDLPLSVNDLRMGMRRFAMYKGTPIFLTDSNIYRILDKMVKKGRFLSFSGYFLPAEMTRGKPIEYWVLKRKLFDHFISMGQMMKEAKGADFSYQGRLVHIFHDISPKDLIRLCKSADNVIIFPDKRSKEDFRGRTLKYDPDWMRVALELQYGRVYCQTIDEFLGRGSNGED
jgi:hypothetical protein